MKSKIFHFFSIIVSCIFTVFSCVFKNVSSNADSQTSISMEETFDKKDQVFLSKFAESIQYVPLETRIHEIDNNPTISANENWFVSIAYKQIFVFDRKSGKFVREISNYGRGPEEYCNSGKYYPERQAIMATSYNCRDISEFDLTGKLNQSISTLQRNTKNSMDTDVNSFNGILDSVTYIYYCENNSGNAPHRIILTNGTGDVLKTIPNHNKHTPKGMFLATGNSLCYHYDGKTFFYENYTDTVFCVTKEGLIPHVILGMGKYCPPYIKKSELISRALDDYFIFNRNSMGESGRFLFFSFYHQYNPIDKVNSSFWGYHDKKTKKSYIADIDDTYQSIVINDIDHFVPLNPANFTITCNNELVTYMEAWKIVEWFEKNPEQAKKLPEHLRNLSNLDPEDNPVVVVINLKQ